MRAGSRVRLIIDDLLRLGRWTPHTDTGGEDVRRARSSSEGRRPAGLRAVVFASASTNVGAYFASVAYLEAAAVLAFDQMLGELRAHRAPVRLLVEAAKAREDEIRHAQITAELACRFGGVLSAVEAPKPRIRDLVGMAIENEVEGIVRETLGAAIATWRASSAGDPTVRRAMQKIAADERRHADLSWALRAWLVEQLDLESQRHLDEARHEAIAELYREVRADPSDVEVRRVAGAPPPETTVEMMRQLDRDLWQKLDRFARA